jgi:hypothetical protein
LSVKENLTGQSKMTTINLYQNDENEKRIASQSMNGGFMFSIAILVVTLLVLTGLKVYNPMVAKKNVALAETIDVENTNLVGLTTLDQLVDTQNRLSVIKSTLEIENGAVKRTEMTKILDELSSDMNKGLSITSYGYTDNKVTANFSAGNFNDASKQIFSLKNSDYFSNVNLQSISRGEDSVLFNIEMEIKK